MKIALLGYGKMGKAIEEIALLKGYEIVLKVNTANASSLSPSDLKKADVAIEFSTPTSAVKNIYQCFEANIPVVSGTTGWDNQLHQLKKDCLAQNQSLLHSSNFSIGVNIFFVINKKLAQLMNGQQQYDVVIEEIHHLQKKDTPSGTAITLSNQILDHLKRKTKWINTTTGGSQSKEDKNKLVILSRREDNIFGTHTIKYESSVDTLEIKHTARSRKDFAEGALTAAVWLMNKKGFFTMEDLLKL